MDTKRIVKSILPYVLVIVAIVLLKMFVVTTVSVSGTSMSPTLHDGDLMILSRVHYYFNDVHRFDIVVVHHEGEDIIKRVIGLPGEKVEYKDNTLYINDQKVEENFEHKMTDDFTFSKFDTEVVPDNMYFVVGDNRTDSYDGRYFGFISKDEIKGSANLVLFPFNRIGVKN